MPSIDLVGSITNATQQADLSNPLISGANKKADGTYNGDLNFSDGGTNSLSSFLTSAAGTYSDLASTAGLQLSTGGFDLTTVFVITGSTGPTTYDGFIAHDDGVTLYDATLAAIIDAPGPVVETNDAYSDLNGAWTLVYVASNGLPEVLNFQATPQPPEVVGQVPLPAGLPLLASGLFGMGLMGWRKRRKVGS